MFEIFIPIAPVAKQRARVCKTHAYTPKETVYFAKAIGLIVKAEMRKRKMQILHNALDVDFDFFIVKPKTVKRIFHTTTPDKDNLEKAMMDALNGILWKDDKQIVSGRTTKQYGEAGIRMRVTDLET